MSGPTPTIPTFPSGFPTEFPTGFPTFPPGSGPPGNVTGLPSGFPMFPPSDPNDNNGPRAAIIMWILFAMSLLFLGLRVYCKISRHRGLWWDDYALIASQIALVIDVALQTKMITMGFGKHLDQIKFEDGPTIIILGAASGVFAIIGVAWSKTSFALTLLRIGDGWVKWVLWIIIITMNIALGLTPLLHMTACRPVRRSWDLSIPGECMDPRILVKYDLFSAAYSAAMDFLLALFPAYLIKDLQMKKREKIGVAIAMGMGVFAGVTACIKCVYIPALADMDFSYTGVDLSIWGTAEISTTIIAASIPVLRVFLRDFKTSMEKYYRQPGLSGTGTTLKKERTVRSGHNTTILAGRDLENSRSSAFRKDDDSDKSILVFGHGRIIQTSEVAVEYHPRSDADARSYEMARIDPHAYRR